MGYTPTLWATGDTITAEKLNNMESGIANDSMFFVSIQENDGSYTADKTVQQIVSAHESGKICAFKLQQSSSEYVVIISGFSVDAVGGQLVSISTGDGTVDINVLSVDIEGTDVTVENNLYFAQAKSE